MTKEELKGLELFNDPEKGNCAACHPSTPGPCSDIPPLFTDFTYDNLGVPSNLGMYGDSEYLKYYYPFYYLPELFNPAGLDFVDYGLGDILQSEDHNGKMKVPTLRNVDMTPPYMHNGVFKTLPEVVHFYNTRDTKPYCDDICDPDPGVNCWPKPEVAENVNTEELGHLGLTADEEKAIVAFMKTLTDEPCKFECFLDDNKCPGGDQ